jgi:hypothetical protein
MSKSLQVWRVKPFGEQYAAYYGPRPYRFFDTRAQCAEWIKTAPAAPIDDEYAPARVTNYPNPRAAPPPSEPKPPSGKRNKPRTKQRAIVAAVMAKGGLQGSTLSPAGWARLLKCPVSTMKLALKNFDSLSKELSSHNKPR